MTFASALAGSEVPCNALHDPLICSIDKLEYLKATTANGIMKLTPPCRPHRFQLISFRNAIVDEYNDPFSKSCVARVPEHQAFTAPVHAPKAHISKPCKRKVPSKEQDARQQLKRREQHPHQVHCHLAENRVLIG